MDLSIVTTLYRSASTLHDFHQRASKAAQALTSSYEIILVNDGSPDNSLELAAELQKKDPRLVVVDLARNFGHHKALMTGLSYSRGNLVYVLDDDLEEEPEWLEEFESKRRAGGADVVYGVQEHRKGGLFERCSGGLFYKLFNLLSRDRIPESATNARLMTRRYVDQLLLHREREVFLPGLWQITGFRQEPMTVTKHAKGSSSYSLARKFSLMVNAITSFSDRPLICIFYMGAFLMLASGLYIVHLLYQKWVHDVPIMGWPSLIVSIWFLGGLTIFFIGVLGIYLSKMYMELKQRPYSIVRQVLPPERGRDTSA